MSWPQKTMSIRVTKKIIWNLRAMDWKKHVRALYVAYNTEREASLVIFYSPLNHIDVCWQLDLQDLVLAWLWFVVQMLENHIKQQYCVSVRRKSSSDCNRMTDARAFSLCSKSLRHCLDCKFPYVEEIQSYNRYFKVDFILANWSICTGCICKIK